MKVKHTKEYSKFEKNTEDLPFHVTLSNQSNNDRVSSKIIHT